jgi:hypothetical protein
MSHLETLPSGRGRRPGGTDVARLAGVSQKTVSRVFNNEPNVTEDTRHRVLAAARRLGYRPNGAAHALLTGRTQRIGVVSHGTAHFGPSSLLVALERATREVAYSLSIVNSFEDDPTGLAGAVDDGGESLVVDVPVLMLGTTPVVHAPMVLSERAAECVTRQRRSRGDSSRWGTGRSTTSRGRSAGGRPVNGHSTGGTHSSPRARRCRSPWRATGPRARATGSARCSPATPT